MAVSTQARAGVLYTSLITVTTVNKTAQFAATSGGTLNQIEIDNTGNTAATYVKVYDLASSVTYGTQDPSHIYFAPASQKITYTSPEGFTFGAGIGLCAATVGGTGAGADSAPTSAVTVHVHYS